MKLPARMARISERMKIPEESHIFKWVEPARI
jgi:acyl-[acyl-carrier-protein] desaturase